MAGTSDPGTQQLIALLGDAKNLVFHVRYQITTTQASAVLELWHNPPKGRLDVTETQGGNVDQSAQITDGQSEDACQRANGQSWTCVGTGLDPNHNPGDVTLGNLSAFESEASYQVSTATILGQPARCFTGTKPLPASALAQAGATGSAPTPPTSPPQGVHHLDGHPSPPRYWRRRRYRHPPRHQRSAQCVHPAGHSGGGLSDVFRRGGREQRRRRNSRH